MACKTTAVAQNLFKKPQSNQSTQQSIGAKFLLVRNRTEHNFIFFDALRTLRWASWETQTEINDS